jgi:hypothetical protein
MISFVSHTIEVKWKNTRNYVNDPLTVFVYFLRDQKSVSSLKIKKFNFAQDLAVHTVGWLSMTLPSLHPAVFCHWAHVFVVFVMHILYSYFLQTIFKSLMSKVSKPCVHKYQTVSLFCCHPECPFRPTHTQIYGLLYNGFKILPSA